MNPLSLSGLDLLRAAVSGDAPLASISETIPMRPLDVELGYVKFSARADGRHLNRWAACTAGSPRRCSIRSPGARCIRCSMRASVTAPSICM